MLPDLSAGRLVEMLERLPLLGGVLYQRAMAEAQQEQTDTVSGVPVRSDPRSSGPRAAGRSAPGRSDAEVVESSREMLIGHPALAGLVEYTTVGGG